MNTNSKRSATVDLRSKKSTGQGGDSSASQPKNPAAAPVKPSASQPMNPAAASVKSAASQPMNPAAASAKSSASQPMNPDPAPVKPSASQPMNPSAAPVKPSASQPMNPAAAPVKPVSPSVAPQAGDVSVGLLPKKSNGHEGSSASQSINPSVVSSRSVQTDASPAKGVSVASSVTKRHGKSVIGSDVPSDNSDGVVLFKDVAFGPQEDELRFRLIHFWEARNTITKALLGLEMLLVDAEGTVIQGYIPPGRIDTYQRHMVPGATYRLNNYFGSKSKEVYRVADPDVTVSFTWKSVLSVLNVSSNRFPEDRFRFHGYEQFEAACDLRGDLYDFLGHIKLVNEQVIREDLVLDEAEIATARRILLHVQTHDGPVMKLYLWDNAATVFCEKFKMISKPPSVILVTTVNPKRFGGALTLSTVSASRVFVDMDVDQTREYLAWYESNHDVANRVNAEVVTKAETATIAELMSYMKQEGSKVAWFECKATIDDVVRESAWYYIACGGCKTKATKGQTTLMCRKCGKTDITGAAEYLTKISVYDKNDQASFVLLGSAGHDLTGKQAAELVESYYEANDGVGDDDHVVPVPQALIGAIGQERTFVIKISKHNLEGKTQTLTVTKVLPLGDPAIGRGVGENVVVTRDVTTLVGGNSGVSSSTENEVIAEEGQKRVCDDVAMDEAKRTKRG